MPRSIVERFCKLSPIIAFVFLLSWPQAALSQSIAVLPFSNRSGFTHDLWKISYDVPAALADTLRQAASSALPFDQVRDHLDQQSIRIIHLSDSQTLAPLAAALKADYLVTGRIKEFGISRFNVGAPVVGGYDAYKALVEIDCKLFNASTGELTALGACTGEVRDRGLGMRLIGRPREQDVDYAALDTLEFDSEEFRATIIGRAVTGLKGAFVDKLRHLLPGGMVDGTTANFTEARVLVVRGRYVYINAGHAEGLAGGAVLQVFSKGDTLRDPGTGKVLGTSEFPRGKIRVETVRDEHLSLAEILEGEISTGDGVWIPGRP